MLDRRVLLSTLKNFRPRGGGEAGIQVRRRVILTALAFRMPLGSVSIPGGQKKELGSVDVNEFSQIQVVADGRVGSATGINIRLTITERSESVRNWSPFRSHLIRRSRGSMTFGKEVVLSLPTR